MTVFEEVARDLVKMFVADARMTAAVLAVVALVWATMALAHAPGLAAGALLALGCLGVLLASVASAARAARKRR